MTKKKTIKLHVKGRKLFTEPGRTEQHHAKEVSTQNIVKRYLETGIEPETKKGGWYGVIPAIDFTEAQDVVIRANQTFNQLPSDIRSAFDNDVQSFLKYCADPDNEEELHGLFGNRPGEDEIEETDPGSPDEPGKDESKDEPKGE